MILQRFAKVVMPFVLAFVAPLWAQQGSEQASSQNITLRPTMTLGDVLFAINVLNTVEIKGSEVDAFLEVKNALVQAVQKAQKEKKTETDQLTLEMNLVTANNFLMLLQRASIPGSAAERFQAVKQALFASASQQAGTQSNQQGQKK